MSSTDEPLRTPRVWFDSITFSDKTRIGLESDDIVVLVGPNNSGKSVALRDLLVLSQARDSPTTVVTEAELGIDGEEEDLIKWLRANAHTSNVSGVFEYTRLDASANEAIAKRYWGDSSSGLQLLAKFFICHLTTEARLSAASPARSIRLPVEPKTHPIHYLQTDDDLEQRVSTLFNEVFGEELIVNRNAGLEVPLHCGQRPVPGPGEDRLSVSYLEKLQKLPTLHDQGDGMRCFAGVLLHSVVVEHSVILIDEPEAFLHPPQARALGQVLADETPQDRQLVLATHSGDLLRGLLDTDSSRVRVVRLERDGLVNRATELDRSGVASVWGDSILRYSNVLDGLFHTKVVLCESDADCRFYAAVLDAIAEETEEGRREHVMFIHCGGKARMPVVIAALKELDVPVAVVADFDVLNSERPLRDICGAIGGRWADLADDWDLVRTSIESKKPDLRAEDVIERIKEILDGVSTATFPVEAKTKIQNVLRKSSPWAAAKTMGRQYVPRGAATNACDRLLFRLREHGVHVVPVGELECFCQSVDGHGPRWVNSVLVKDLLKDSELGDAREFVSQVLRSTPG
jgi:energy-coupling factor transporter ATP-binding protein EcfA2